MAKYLPLPDGSSLKVPDDMSYEEAMSKAQAKFPDLFVTPGEGPKSGFMPALKSGVSGLKSGIAALAGKTGIMDEAAAEQYMKEQEAYQAKTFKPTETFGEAPLTKTAELLGGSLPYMAAPVVAGGLAASAPVAGALGLGAAGATALGLGATGLTSAAQFTGSNIQRQMGTGKTLGETELGAAALAAIPQAALDVVSLKMLPGIRGILAAGGKEVSEVAAKRIAEQGIKEAAKDYALTTGKAMGAEGLTEAAQQVLERAQAGLKLTDPAAREEYFDSFIGGAVLGGAIAPVGRRLERGAEQTRQEQTAAEETKRSALQVAAETEAAKTTPEALTQLDTQYQDAKRRMSELQSTVAKKPTKASTPEEKQAYADAKQELTRFQKEDFAPVRAEYDKRKQAIGAMQDAQLADIEQRAAEGQPTATDVTPTGVSPVPMPKLMERYDQLRGDLDTLEEQLAAGPSLEEQTALSQQRQALKQQTESYGKLLEERGGLAMTAAEHTQAVKEADSAIAREDVARKKLLSEGDFDTADKQAAKIAELMTARQTLAGKRPLFQETQAFKESKPGETQQMFSEQEMPAPVEQKAPQFTSPEGKEITPPAPVAEVAKPEVLKEEPAKGVQFYNERLAEAVQAKDATKTGEALHNINETENEIARSKELPAKNKVVWDLFSTPNLLANGDPKTIETLARAGDLSKQAERDAKGREEKRMQQVLDERLGLGGTGKAKKTGEPLRSVKRERANLFEDLYNDKAKALFKNGNSLEQVEDASGEPVSLQKLYDEEGTAAVEMAVVMDKIRALKKKVETPQGNAKKSIYQKMMDLAAEHESLLAQRGESLAAQTTGETKVSPATAKARDTLDRQIKAAEAQYNTLLGQVEPVRKKIEAEYASLYKTAPLETVEKEREAKKALLLPETGARSMSKTARTQARIESGDVRKEAETSANMRDLARDLGQETPEYKKMADARAKRLTSMIAKYGQADPSVAFYSDSSNETLKAKAIELGKTTPEYKATLKEQIEVTRESLAGSKQTLKSKRGTQTTRKVSLAKKEEATGSPESRALGAKRHMGKAMSVREQERLIKEVNDSDNVYFRTSNPGTKGVSLDSLKTLVTKMTANWSNAPDIVSVADFSALPKNIRDQALADGVQDIIPGVYDPSTKKVYLVAAHITGPVDAVATVAHEATGHFGLREMLGNSLNSELDRLYAGNSDIRAQADAKLKQSPKLSKQVAVEEVLAEMAEADPNAQAPGVLRRVYNVVKALIRRLTGQTVSDADVQQVVANARKFVVYGPAAAGVKPSTESAAFKNWFGASKVVDAEGKPLVVYHGTGADFSTFDTEKPKVSGAYHGAGFYFGDSSTASAYAGEETPSVIPVYLRMENPFIGELKLKDISAMRKNMPAFDAAYDKHLDEVGAGGSLPSIERLGVLSGDRNNFIQQALIAAGYDGRIVLPFPAASITDPETEFVVFNANQIKSSTGNTGAYRKDSDNILYRGASGKKGEFDAEQEPSTVNKLLGNIMGLAGRMQLVDKFAAVSEAFKKGMKAGVISDTEAGNAEYLLRFGEHRSQLAGQALTNGPLTLVTTKTDKGIEHTFKSIKGANALQMAEALNKGGFANDTEAEGMLTLYVSGARAKQVGWEKLNYSDAAAEKAKHQRLMDVLNANPKQKSAIEEAAKIYQQFNNGQIDFLVQTGELTAAKAAELKAITYIPFYRVNAQGEVQLMIDKEHPVRIGNIKDEPQLQQLVGDNKQIMPIFTSMVQNTFMLTNLGLRNQSVKETAFMLRKIGIASRIGQGPGPRGADTVRFKKNGVDMHVIIDTDMYGIPAEYIVKGMEGIKTTIPAVVKLLGIPADILRKFVTRSPTYAVRQMIRDPLNAWLTTGTDAFPVLSSFKELASMVAGRSETERTLMESGAVSSNVFTGDERDMGKVLREITSGKAGWAKLIAKADAFALQGDSATRATIYKDSTAKGMSHQQALLRAVESMNFSRRGLSPSIQMLSTMIPFFNAQIQGMDVLYRAFKGDMSYSEQLQIREKLFKRGLMLAVGTMAYAAAMQDDEAYKRAKPEERYGNWFVYIPGVSEPLRVPIPFELGYLFKSLPEAVFNMAYGDEKASSALGGVGKLLAQSNPFALPQAIKPLTEVVLGKSFFSGDIESEREKNVLATDRYRESSTEVAKLLGSVTGMVGVSPIKIDYLIRGYTGGLGIALVQLANPLLNTEVTGVEKPSMKPSKIPFIGGLFQPVEGRGTLDAAYDKMLEIQQVKGTYNKLIEEGKRAEAQAFVQQYSTQLALVSTSGSVQKTLGQMAAQERAIKSSTAMSTEQKDKALERLDKMKVAYARQFITLADRTRPQ